MKFIDLLLITLLLGYIYTSSIYASSTVNAEQLAKKLHLMAGYKAIIQWERIFKSDKKMKRYKIDTLKDDEKLILKEYLIKHAIDSDHPTVAGEF